MKRFITTIVVFLVMLFGFSAVAQPIQPRMNADRRLEIVNYVYDVMGAGWITWVAYDTDSDVIVPTIEMPYTAGFAHSYDWGNTVWARDYTLSLDGSSIASGAAYGKVTASTLHLWDVTNTRYSPWPAYAINVDGVNEDLIIGYSAVFGHAYDTVNDEWDRLMISSTGGLKTGGYVDAANAQRTNEIDPLDQKYNEDTLADVTNGTGAPTTYHYYVDMAGYRYLATQMTLTGSLTVTYRCSVACTVAPGSCTYQDVTNDAFGVVSFTATDMATDNSMKLAGCKYVDVQVIAAGGGSDDWLITAKKWW